ncbi:glycosyl hydrolase [Micrococcales bacterium 31B]|nr:glycosyl hydrolase [Micrococcales bacterium 31B]
MGLSHRRAIRRIMSTQTTKATSTVDLTAAPFNLQPADIEWVNQTIDGMTLDEKIGQLFINLNTSLDLDYVQNVVTKYHVGGLRYNNGTPADVQAHIRHAQEHAKVPLLVASNPEVGGQGSCWGGTLVATHLQAGSTADASVARDLGRIGGAEAAAVGCNWAFAPIVDIHYNWRNTVISTRAFGNTPDIVIERANAMFEGLSEAGQLAAIKHFPGDGLDERDQHVVTTWNTQTRDEWDASFGRVYREMIASGVQSIMIGHIGAPHLSRSINPDLTDADLLPATLSKELTTGLLREELGFNGLILTDASVMVGFTSAMPRRDAVPAAIAAGCDMFLFFRTAEEDLRYMREGIESGVVTEQRLRDALTRILGLKASIGLHRTPREQIVPGPEALEIIGCDEHLAAARRAAEAAVTLVKDTANRLPLRPETHKRVRLYSVTGDKDFHGASADEFIQLAEQALTAQGFEVSRFDAPRGFDGLSRLTEEANENYPELYDAAIVFANVVGFAQEGAIRIKWAGAMSGEIPWYQTEVPTVFVSLAQPNHLVDVPMVKTVVHAHNPTAAGVQAAVDAITGAIEFRGTFNENVWCDTFGTRI